MSRGVPIQALNQSQESRSPLADAMAWVSRIFAISLVMILPIALGQWLDGRTGFAICGPLGIAIGLVLGIVALVKLTGPRASTRG